MRTTIDVPFHEESDPIACTEISWLAALLRLVGRRTSHPPSRPPHGDRTSGLWMHLTADSGGTAPESHRLPSIASVAEHSAGGDVEPGFADGATHGHPPPMKTHKLNKLSDIDWTTWKPVDLATLLFVLRGDEVLLIRKKRGLGAGLINGPGGRLDPGETPREAAIREVQEELAVTPHAPRWLGEHRFQFRDGYSLYVHVFTSDSFEGEATETDEAVPLWVHRDAMPYDEMWVDDRHWLPLLLAGQRFSGHYIFDEQVMVDMHIHVLGSTEPDGDVGVRRLAVDVQST